jgi:hypothetical protein
MSQLRNPSLSEVIRAHLAHDRSALHVALPAKVESYDATKQLVNVKPLVKDFYFDADGEKQAVSIPVIPNVPVVFPGAGGFRLTFPIAAGDTVLLVFAERSIDVWLEKGTEVDPLDFRRHDLSDAIAIPGLNAKPDAWTGASTSNATLGKDGGPQIEFKAAEIVLGGGTAKVAREGDDVAVNTTPSGLGAPPLSMQAWMAAVTLAINTLAPGSITGTPTTIGTIDEGAANVKA